MTYKEPQDENTDSHEFHVKQAKKRLAERDKNFKKKIRKLNKFMRFSGQRTIK